MPRLRVGVALLLPPPFDREVDGLRRATGDGSLGRIPAHLTLVPPVNVRDDRLADALAVLREAAGATRPFQVTLGPPATFLPDSPTLYLAAAGAGEQEVCRLRERVFREPLARPLTWPFVPHVTVADEAEPGRIAAAVQALADYRADVRFDRVHLLREGPGRVWAPIADAAFAVPAVVGRGGLPVELTVSAAPDPEALALAEVEGTAGLTVTARRDGRLAGYATGWCRHDVGHLSDLVVGPEHRGLGVAGHLVAAFRSEAARRGCTEMSLGPASDEADGLR
jgi:2'-5' RNA ligase